MYITYINNNEHILPTNPQDPLSPGSPLLLGVPASPFTPNPYLQQCNKSSIL